MECPHGGTVKIKWSHLLVFGEKGKLGQNTPAAPGQQYVSIVTCPTAPGEQNVCDPLPSIRIGRRRRPKSNYFRLRAPHVAVYRYWDHQITYDKNHELFLFAKSAPPGLLQTLPNPPSTNPPLKPFRPPRPHAPGARMTVVTLTPSNY